MKQLVLIILGIIFSAIGIKAQTAGLLTVTTTTSSAGGNYAPRNILAIWIEDEQGNWVKTLMAYANARITHLNIWEASTSAAGSTYNVVDAITGPTQNNHSERISSWNGTNLNGTVVPDGTYRLIMELTDKNGTGNYSTFTFIKGPNPVNLTPSNVPSFSSISIVWEPNTVSIADIEVVNTGVFPNPTTGKFNIKGENITEVKVWSADGKLIFEGKSSLIDLSEHPEGIYYIRISSGKEISNSKIILQR